MSPALLFCRDLIIMPSEEDDDDYDDDDDGVDDDDHDVLWNVCHGRSSIAAALFSTHSHFITIAFLVYTYKSKISV